MGLSLPVPSVGLQTENGGRYHFTRIHKSISKGIPYPSPFAYCLSCKPLSCSWCVSVWLFDDVFFFPPVTVHSCPFQVGAINRVIPDPRLGTQWQRMLLWLNSNFWAKHMTTDTFDIWDSMKVTWSGPSFPPGALSRRSPGGFCLAASSAHHLATPTLPLIIPTMWGKDGWSPRCLWNS